MVAAFPSIDMVRTGKRIETVRKNRGLSVRDIQEYFGFEYPQAVYKWQHGECLPSVDNLFALAHLLRVGMEDLLVTLGSEGEDREVPLFFGFSPRTLPGKEFLHRRGASVIFDKNGAMGYGSR